MKISCFRLHARVPVLFCQKGSCCINQSVFLYSSSFSSLWARCCSQVPHWQLSTVLLLLIVNLHLRWQQELWFPLSENKCRRVEIRNVNLTLRSYLRSRMRAVFQIIAENYAYLEDKLRISHLPNVFLLEQSCFVLYAREVNSNSHTVLLCSRLFIELVYFCQLLYYEFMHNGNNLFITCEA